MALRRRAGFGLRVRVGLGFAIFRPGNIVRNILAVQTAQQDGHVFVD
jgi:hypothetical protein